VKSNQPPLVPRALLGAHRNILTNSTRSEPARPGQPRQLPPDAATVIASSRRSGRVIARTPGDYVEEGHGPIISSHMVGILVVENKFQPYPRLVWNG
jgi:hypothetical protein